MMCSAMRTAASPGQSLSLVSTPKAEISVAVNSATEQDNSHANAKGTLVSSRERTGSDASGEDTFNRSKGPSSESSGEIETQPSDPSPINNDTFCPTSLPGQDATMEGDSLACNAHGYNVANGSTAGQPCAAGSYLNEANGTVRIGSADTVPATAVDEGVDESQIDFRALLRDGGGSDARGEDTFNRSRGPSFESSGEIETQPSDSSPINDTFWPTSLLGQDATMEGDSLACNAHGYNVANGSTAGQPCAAGSYLNAANGTVRIGSADTVPATAVDEVVDESQFDIRAFLRDGGLGSGDPTAHSSSSEASRSSQSTLQRERRGFEAQTQRASPEASWKLPCLHAPPEERCGQAGRPDNHSLCQDSAVDATALCDLFSHPRAQTSNLLLAIRDPDGRANELFSSTPLHEWRFGPCCHCGLAVGEYDRSKPPKVLHNSFAKCEKNGNRVGPGDVWSSITKRPRRMAAVEVDGAGVFGAEAARGASASLVRRKRRWGGHFHVTRYLVSQMEEWKKRAAGEQGQEEFEQEVEELGGLTLSPRSCLFDAAKLYGKTWAPPPIVQQRLQKLQLNDADKAVYAGYCRVFYDVKEKVSFYLGSEVASAECEWHPDSRVVPADRVLPEGLFDSLNQVMESNRALFSLPGVGRKRASQDPHLQELASPRTHAACAERREIVAHVDAARAQGSAGTLSCASAEGAAGGTSLQAVAVHAAEGAGSTRRLQLQAPARLRDEHPESQRQVYQTPPRSAAGGAEERGLGSGVRGHGEGRPWPEKHQPELVLLLPGEARAGASSLGGGEFWGGGKDSGQPKTEPSTPLASPPTLASHSVPCQAGGWDILWRSCCKRSCSERKLIWMSGAILLPLQVWGVVATSGEQRIWQWYCAFLGLFAVIAAWLCHLFLERRVWNITLPRIIGAVPAQRSAAGTSKEEVLTPVDGDAGGAPPDLITASPASDPGDQKSRDDSIGVGPDGPGNDDANAVIEHVIDIQDETANNLTTENNELHDGGDDDDSCFIVGDGDSEPALSSTCPSAEGPLTQCDTVHEPLPLIPPPSSLAREREERLSQESESEARLARERMELEAKMTREEGLRLTARSSRDRLANEDEKRALMPWDTGGIAEMTNAVTGLVSLALVIVLFASIATNIATFSRESSASRPLALMQCIFVTVLFDGAFFVRLEESQRNLSRLRQQILEAIRRPEGRNTLAGTWITCRKCTLPVGRWWTRCSVCYETFFWGWRDLFLLRELARMVRRVGRRAEHVQQCRAHAAVEVLQGAVRTGGFPPVSVTRGIYDRG